MSRKPKATERIRMYIRVDRETRSRFKVVAELNGETMEGRAERLLIKDIGRNFPRNPSTS